MKRLRIKLTRKRNDLLLGELVSLGFEPVAGFYVLETAFFHFSSATFIQICKADQRKSALCLDWSLVTRHLSLFQRAVSSAVEHLVYTEGVGGSKPSPPISIFPLAICSFLNMDRRSFPTAFENLLR